MVRITERDVRLLAACAAAQWLTTGQIRRMFFRDSSLDAVRKRLRKLSESEHLHSSQSNRMAEMLHTVGRSGLTLLTEKGLEVKSIRKMPDQIEHRIGINDVRIAVESGSWRVHYFFACWELGQFGWSHPVIPDAVFSIQPDQRMTFMAEYDRGTEGREMLRRKLRQYERLLVSSYRFNGVIIVAESMKLRERLCQSLIDQRRFPLGICCISEIIESGAEERIFTKPGGAKMLSLAELSETAT
jgi:hypothetical protein